MILTKFSICEKKDLVYTRAVNEKTVQHTGCSKDTRDMQFTLIELPTFHMSVDSAYIPLRGGAPPGAITPLCPP
jgi:hypothetical protein